METKRVHLRARGRTDAVKFPDRQRLDESRSHFWCEDILTVRLAIIRCKLRQEFVVRNSGRSVKTGDFFDPGADRQRDVARQRNVLEIFGDVEIGLVE